MVVDACDGESSDVGSSKMRVVGMAVRAGLSVQQRAPLVNIPPFAAALFASLALPWIGCPLQQHKMPCYQQVIHAVNNSRSAIAVTVMSMIRTIGVQCRGTSYVPLGL